MDKRAKDELGNRYHCLEVIDSAPSEGRGAMWLCACDCGNEVVIRAASLRRGYNKDCGCGVSGHKKLHDALIDIGDPPCDKGCFYREKCSVEELACDQYRSWYLWGGDIDPHPQIFRPTKATFEAIFDESDQQQKQRGRRRKRSRQDPA